MSLILKFVVTDHTGIQSVHTNKQTNTKDGWDLGLLVELEEIYSD